MEIFFNVKKKIFLSSFRILTWVAYGFAFKAIEDFGLVFLPENKIVVLSDF